MHTQEAYERSALLLHGYHENPTPIRTNGRDIQPDTNSRFVTIAGALYVHGHPEVHQVVIPIGIGDPTIGERMANLFQQLAPAYPRELITLAPRNGGATTTILEAQIGAHLITDLPKTAVLAIGRGFHCRRIELDDRRQLSDAASLAVLSADTIITTYAHEHPSRASTTQLFHLLTEWKAGDEEIALNRRETILYAIDRLPGGDNILLAINAITNGSRELNSQLFELLMP